MQFNKKVVSLQNQTETNDMKKLIEQLTELFKYKEGTFSFSTLIDQKVYLVEATITQGFPQWVSVSIDGTDSHVSWEELIKPFHHMVHQAFKTLNK